MLQAADKKRVTKSIGDLGRKVTAADVSAKTGLPMLIVSQALNQIASETHGRMAVSQSGDVLYSFSLGFANAYLASGLRSVLEKLGEKVFNVAFFILRISFGVVLLMSFFIVVFLFLMLFATQKAPSSGRRGGGRPPALKNNLFYLILLRDAFLVLFNPSRPHTKFDYRFSSVKRREKSNFLLDCFSLLFGDGDPNEGIAEKRWQLIAKVIKQHDNVITAEQLAPYTGADPSDEDAVLPVLARFDGKPEVTDSGNIIYTFPSLAVTSAVDDNEPAPSYLEEFHFKFTECDEAALKPIYFMAGLNFCGSWALWLLLASKNAPSISALLTTLVVYGTLFVVVPVVRSWWLEFVNRKIDDRNSRRHSYAEALVSPEMDLRNKISESREYRLRDHRFAHHEIVYSTDRDALEQTEGLTQHFSPGDAIDAKPEETFDASPRD